MFLIYNLCVNYWVTSGASATTMTVQNPEHNLIIIGFKYRIMELEAKLHAITIIVYQEFNNSDKLKEQMRKVI